jgi:hypothetical protein
VFGLVLGFLGADLIVTVAFCAASVFLILTAFPSESKMRKLVGR